MDSKRYHLQESLSPQSRFGVFPKGISPNSNIHSIPIGIWEEHPNAHSNTWSSTLYTILGVDQSPDFIPSLSTLTKGIKANDKQRFSDFLNAITHGSAVRSMAVEVTYRSGRNETKNLMITAERVGSSQQEKGFWRGVIQDISAVRLCETNFNLYAQSALNYFERFPLFMLILDGNGKLTYWNSVCERITGHKSNDLAAGKDVFKQLFPLVNARKRLRTAMQNADFEPYDEEFEIETKRGRKFLSKWTIFPYRSAHNDLNVAAIGRDISKQVVKERALEQKLHQAKIISKVTTSLFALSPTDNYYHHLGSTLENQINDMLFLVSSAEPDQQFFTIEGGYGFSSSEWQQVVESVGWNPIGRRYQLQADSTSLVKAAKVQAIEQSLYTFSDGLVSSVASRNLERIFSIERFYSVGIQTDQKVFGWILIAAQSSEVEESLQLVLQLARLYAQAMQRREVEQAVLQSRDAAQEANRLKSAYLANIGHEIRTPMNAIIGFTQLLNIPNLSKNKRKEYVDIINRKGQMLVKLINDMVDVTRVESGQLTVVKSLFSPSRLLNNLRDFYSNERLFQHREAVEVRLVVPPNSDDFMLYSDEGRLEQVFTNLLDNALKFTEKGFVEFGYRVKDSTVEFYVKDSGIGIDPAMHRVVFDRYRQLDERIERAKEGKGLGLTICKGIVELLNGKIWVESEPGEGAAFLFEIPLGTDISKPMEAVQQDEDQDVPAMPDWKNKVLLIAEDEEINYLLISEMLEGTGVNILWAKDGVQAVELVDTIKNIDAILMDIRMPNKDGYAASLEIHQINPDIPIIAQTAYAFSEDRAKAEAAGCNDYITKPISSQQLLSILDGYLG
ncbi:ATP-binding protein [Perlabentimonas gracilis]|uniref:ATP-binding protein n=1 Tax=Perlabentimonas gracilis TaxID=2715279 RepID=UPI00140AE151|nr:ATP-binding protein [Perlabentimonas gracilis]NHB67228.1 response regulator [Perlabentimonas gracilis]